MNWSWLIGIIILIVLGLALYWEYQDHHRILARPQWTEEVSPEVRFYACYNAENRISWRTIFIGSIITTVIIAGLLGLNHYPILATWLIAIFLTVFLVFYAVDHFQTFHLYRPMCAQLDGFRTIL